MDVEMLLTLSSKIIKVPTTNNNNLNHNPAKFVYIVTTAIHRKDLVLLPDCNVMDVENMGI